MERAEALELLRRETPRLRAEFAVESLALFGSTARGEARDDSDLDLLVTFEGPASFDRFMGLKLHLEDLLGMTIDLVTPAALRPRLRPQIERDLIHVT